MNIEELEPNMRGLQSPGIPHGAEEEKFPRPKVTSPSTLDILFLLYYFSMPYYL
jgi:hypothetical protein